MYESNKKTNKKPIKIIIKSSINSSQKLSNIKNEETQYKDNPIENSFSEINKNKISHENKLKQIELLEKELKDIEKENDLILKEMSIIKNINKKLVENYNKINNVLEKEKGDLDQIKEINSSKNREYLELSRLRRENINNNSNNNENGQNYTNSSRGNSENDNNENDRYGDIFNGINFLLNISRLRRNEEENDESIRVNSMSEDNNEEGPSMTTQQLQALPTLIYPRNNNNNEKCIICGFDFCYNDTIIKLTCSHTFHKNCLINRLTARNSSKCPNCKASII